MEIFDQVEPQVVSFSNWKEGLRSDRIITSQTSAQKEAWKVQGQSYNTPHVERWKVIEY